MHTKNNPCYNCRTMQCKQCTDIVQAIKFLESEVRIMRNDFENRAAYMIGLRRYYKRQLRYKKMTLQYLKETLSTIEKQQN